MRTMQQLFGKLSLVCVLLIFSVEIANRQQKYYRTSTSAEDQFQFVTTPRQLETRNDATTRQDVACSTETSSHFPATVEIQTRDRVHKIKLNKYKIHVTVPFEAVFATLKVCGGHPKINMVNQSNLVYSLGLGLNYAEIRTTQIYDNMSSHQSVHLVTIERQRRATFRQRDGDSIATCFVQQHCDLPVYPHLQGQCGVQGKRHNSSLGYWMLNCRGSCVESQCDWDSARWFPSLVPDVQHMQPDVQRVQPDAQHVNQCKLRDILRDKNVMFLGDSTNRGIMYSLLEEVNGSLTEVTKSHDFITYRNVGDNSTFSFFYYPAFWLDKWKTFTETLTDMISHGKSCGELSSLILVIGGVQWLTSQQLRELHAQISRYRVSPTQIYIKTYSSGFLYPLPSMPYTHNEESLKQLVIRNSRLVEQATHLGFNVVDTLQMTLSRYNEFLQGGCACHFHKVEKTPKNTDLKQKFIDLGILDVASSENAKYKTNFLAETYHITGNIHTSYTDMFKGLMCNDKY